ncbi:MAG: hemerythrin domain-containing protein [Ilumatobacteraceae bacterium]
MFQVDLPRAVMGFVGVHLGLRAEVANVQRLVEDGDDAAARRRARLLATVLHHHHTAEDSVLFPALRERHPGAATTTAALEAEHDQLDATLAALVRDVTTIGATRRLVERHLGAEEHQVLPIWMSSFSTEEHERFTVGLRRATPLRDAGLMIAWLLDTAPEGAVELAWDQVPPSLRAVHRIWWRRRYERAYGSLSASGRPALGAHGAGGLGRLAPACAA